MLLLKKKLAIPYLLLIPTVFLLLLLPAFLAGRSAESLLTIYVNQVASGGVGSGTAGTGTGLPTQGAGRSNTFPGSQPDANNRTTQPGNTRTGNNPGSGPTGPGNASSGPGQTGGTSFNNTLTLNAPSFYQWLPANAPTGWKWLGIALAGLLILLIAILLLASKQALTATILLKTTLVFAIGIPFLLPEMHERYFYLADVLSIVAAFSFPRTCFVAIVVQLCSLLSYAPYFLNQQIISLAYVAGAELAMLLVVLFDLLLALFPAWQHKLRELMSDDEASSASSYAG
jgi:hypothetical protein